MRWILLTVSIAGFGVAFTTRSSALLGTGLLAGFAGLIGFVFALASARIANATQTDAALNLDPQIIALRRRAQQARAASIASATKSAARSADENGGESTEL